MPIPRACATHGQARSAGVLIADPALRTAVVFALEAEGVRVGVRANVAQLGADKGAGCLIIDLASHEPAQAAQLDALRRLPEHAPMIVLASCPSRRMHEAIKAIGATLVEKPLLTDTLCETVNRLIESAPRR